MNETKKTYVKPAIEGVYLLPDEAVLGLCKIAATPGPGHTSDCLQAVPVCPEGAET